MFGAQLEDSDPSSGIKTRISYLKKKKNWIPKKKERKVT